MRCRQAALLPGLLIAGCAPAVSGGGFDAPDPAARAYAIEQVIREQDQSAIPDLVEQLDHDDPLVRFMAIAALERLTGHRFGYVHHAPRRERLAAIERWVQFALDHGEEKADKAGRMDVHGG